MVWTWRFEGPDGTEVTPAPPAPAAEEFPNQADAESWLGEVWRDLREGGVAQVTLLEDGRTVYGPMGLDPA